MKIIYQIGIIFALCWVSEIVENLLPFAFPASVIGMLLLFVLLIFGILKVEHIREKSDFLLSNMAFFFIPAGVSIINYFDVLAGNVGKLLLICLFTTILTFAVTAWTIRGVLWLMNRRQADSGRIEADITGKAGTEENRTAERKIKEGRKEYV
ncbi:MAG TPA: CidA/LrgA family protein [Candidatus Eisenbergiella intestinipullorum]|nr:CidA/LrgA family protein [Candidatus Eisenbergiella intestinipullorum]